AISDKFHDECGVVAIFAHPEAEKLEISIDGTVLVSSTVAELNQAYESALEAALRTDPELVAAD
ncbi:MAG: hypothetical protein WCB05_02785, partial [Candidatus Sulfotelmatobacter sp.]